MRANHEPTPGPNPLASGPSTNGSEPDTPDPSLPSEGTYSIPGHLKALALAGAVVITVSELLNYWEFGWLFADLPSSLLGHPVLYAVIGVAFVWVFYSLISLPIGGRPFTQIHGTRAKNLALLASVSSGLVALSTIIAVAKYFTFTDFFLALQNFAYFLYTPLLCTALYWMIRGHSRSEASSAAQASLATSRKISLVVLGLSAASIVCAVASQLATLGLNYSFSPTGMLSIASILATHGYPALVALSLRFAATSLPDSQRARSYAIGAVIAAVLSVVFAIAAKFDMSQDVGEFYDLYSLSTAKQALYIAGFVLLAIPTIAISRTALERQRSLNS